MKLCSLDVRNEGQSGHPTEERVGKNDRTERSVNAPGGITQFEKVECPPLFLHRLSLTDPQQVVRPNRNTDQDHMRLLL
jgi:hypothetical protein